MALQAWTGRTPQQIDADSPNDIVLWATVDDDFTHLRQVVYGNQSGGFLTPIDGHEHSGADSVVIGTNGVPEAAIQGAAVTVSKIKFSTHSASIAISSTGYARLALIEYCHYPKCQRSGGSGSVVLFGNTAGFDLGIGYIFDIWAYNTGTATNFELQASYHSASEQIIEVYKDPSTNGVLGVVVTEVGNEKSAKIMDNNGDDIPMISEIYTIKSHPELFNSIDQSAKFKAEDYMKDITKIDQKLKLSTKQYDDI